MRKLRAIETTPIPWPALSCRITDYQQRAKVYLGATPSASAPAITQTLWEVTSTLQYRQSSSLATCLEYRYDKPNQNVCQDGGRPASYQPTLSLEVIYFF